MSDRTTFDDAHAGVPLREVSVFDTREAALVDAAPLATWFEFQSDLETELDGILRPSIFETHSGFRLLARVADGALCELLERGHSAMS